MNTLVTGGAGFIGSHLVGLLLERGQRVTVLDDFSTGKRENLLQHPELAVIRGDVADPETVTRAVQSATAVVHLAAVASVQASSERPLETHRTNLTGTVTLLQAAAAAGVKRFVYASSAAVYGNPGLPAGTPLGEAAPTAPLTPYAIDKLAGEQYLRWFAEKHGMQARAFRFFNVYGERQDPTSPYSGVISIFSDRLKAGKPVIVFGDGRQTRDFVAVKDVVRLLAESPGGGPAGLSVLNLGTGRGTDLLQLLEVLGSLTGRSVEIRHAEARAGDVRHSLADNSALLERFPETVFTSLRDGLAALV